MIKLEPLDAVCATQSLKRIQFVKLQTHFLTLLYRSRYSDWPHRVKVTPLKLLNQPTFLKQIPLNLSILASQNAQECHLEVHQGLAIV